MRAFIAPQTGNISVPTDGGSIVFVSTSKRGTSPRKWRVRCPTCNVIVLRTSAFRHQQHCRTDGDLGTAPEAENAEPSNRKRKSVDADSEFQEGADDLSANARNPTQKVLQEICGDVPVELTKSFIASMLCSPFQVIPKHHEADAFGVVVPDRSAQHLAKALKAGFCLQKLNLTDVHLAPTRSEKDPTIDYDDLTDEHLDAIENGGAHGRERLVGGIIKTGHTWLQILCVESYNRDCFEDPHAEPVTQHPSSVPNTTRSTQYEGKLRISIMWDGHGKRRLIIGVRRHSYLVTSGKKDDTIVIGPTSCGEFLVNKETTLSIRKKRQNPNELDDEILGLAQVRSHFGHRATFTPRRTALLGFSALTQMPVTVFTLGLWSNGKSPQQSVFYHLWRRSKEPGPLILRLEDLQGRETGKEAGLLKALRALISDEGTLEISANSEAEDILSQLANHLSSQISDKNKIAEKNINSD